VSQWSEGACDKRDVGVLQCLKDTSRQCSIAQFVAARLAGRCEGMLRQRYPLGTQQASQLE
jgi:hypothetical protein